jgi:tetratricopeptide (TPR) repeat protein
MLWTASGKAVTSPPTEPNDGASATAVLSRIMRAQTSKSAETQRSTQSAITRQLWRSRVLAPEQTDDAEAQITLNDLVRRIRSVKFETREQPLDAAPFTTPEPTRRHLDTILDQGLATQSPAQSPAAPSAPLENPLSDEAAEALKRVIADPNQAGNPLELAELLYLTGRLPEAAVLYRKALDVATGKGLAAQADRAWILLQLGNCLRDARPAEARDIYARLVAEYPDCPWVDLAKTNSQFTTWYEQVQPRQWVMTQEPAPTRQVAASQKAQP